MSFLNTLIKIYLNIIAFPIALSLLPAYIIYKMNICKLNYWELVGIMYVLFYIKNISLTS